MFATKIPNNVLNNKPNAFGRWLLVGYIQASRLSTDLVCGMDTGDLEKDLKKQLHEWIRWSELNTNYTRNDCNKYWDDLVFNREDVFKNLMKIL